METQLQDYETQLEQVELALETSEEGSDRNNLLSLKDDLKQLIALTRNSSCTSDATDQPQPQDEFALFMAEMEKEGVLVKNDEEEDANIDQELKMLEGMKCRAPHKHQWGDTVYHNALVCSVLSEKGAKFDEIQVKVLFTNPTHQEMLPCPYYLETDCKFSEEQCRYSHGEIVSFSALQEYVEPNFELLSVGSPVLVKQSNKLWHRAKVKKMYGEKCLVRFDTNQKDAEIELEEVLPLETEAGDDEERSASDSEDRDDVINMSLVNSASEDALGDWEKYTKGIGSKLMQKMGYVIGTGLGRRCDGRIDPVTAVILPAGKSLDHCMLLRENSGGDKNLFSVERKLKRQQRKQEMQNQRAYEREKKKVDVFNFLNETLSGTGSANGDSENLGKKVHREDIKKESARSLNVASLKVDEDIRRVEQDLFKIEETLTRHSDVRSQMNRNLRGKLSAKRSELSALRVKALNIKNEQAHRNDKKKLTIF